MRRLGATLFVTTTPAWLRREGEAVVVESEGKTLLKTPVHVLDAVVCLGPAGMTPQLMAYCAERGVSVTFLAQSGRFLARVVGPTSGSVLLRRAQHQAADDTARRAELARPMVAAKILNCREVLMRAARDRPEAAGVEQLARAAARLRELALSLDHNPSLERLRGLEGEAAHVYFSVFDHLVTGDKEAFYFQGRSRRPPMDNLNSMLSFLYTLLAHDLRSALETVGLDPQIGFLHADRPGRPSLALDLMEEMRPALADRLALNLINRRQITAEGFRTRETGAVVMEDETRREVLAAWQRRKQEESVHPFFKERMPLGLLPHAQAMLLARALRGDIDGYAPWIRG